MEARLGIKPITLLALLLLTGCGTVQADLGAVKAKVEGDLGVATQVASGVQQFTQADVQAALADAVAKGDGVGVVCWKAISDVVSGPLPIGLASTIQKGRDVIIANVPFKCQGIIPGLAIPAVPGMPF